MGYHTLPMADSWYRKPSPYLSSLQRRVRIPWTGLLLLRQGDFEVARTDKGSRGECVSRDLVPVVLDLELGWD